MRIERVTAVAFGPFVNESLDLAPALTVIYGANESGKSSWHAAIYAGLCGQRRARGRGTKMQQEFRSRHQPWLGSRWAVSTDVVLDDGRRVEIAHDLSGTGGSTVVDARTETPIADDLQFEGSADGSVLLGLNRNTSLATLFIRQADILRVLEDADELQEFLQRAAASSAVDTTVEQALAVIDAHRKEKVGTLRVGSRGPLATARRKRDDERLRAANVQDMHDRFRKTLTGRFRAELELNEAESDLMQLETALRSVQAERLEERITRARKLRAQVDGAPPPAAHDPDLPRAVAAAVTAAQQRPELPDDLEGPSVDELRAELEMLPEPPVGDLEPASEVTDAFGEWQRGKQRHIDHQDHRPTATSSVSRGVAPSEVRMLADELERPMPSIDPSVEAEVATLRTSGTSSGRHLQASVFVSLGIGLAVLGSALALLTEQRVGGVAAVIAGAALAMYGLRRGDSAPEMHYRVQEAETRLAIQRENVAQAQTRRDGALRRLTELGLPDDPSSLRALAAEADDEAGRQARMQRWEQRNAQLVAAVNDLERRLSGALDAKGVTTDDGLEGAMATYVAECRERADRARKAARRSDLLGQIRSRSAAEASHERQSDARRRAEDQLRAVAQQVSVDGEGVNELVVALTGWLRREESTAERRRQAAEAEAALEELLDGRQLSELEADLADLRGTLSHGPTAEVPVASADIEDEILRSEARVRSLRDRVAELSGQLQHAEQDLPHVAAAMETEELASSRVDHIESLKEDLEAAAEFLIEAKERVNADIAPIISRTLRPWIPRITDGRYDDVRIDPSTLGISVREAGGSYRDATILSHGTTEQLFLLLRLALAEHLVTTGETAPLIMDDVTVQSDRARTLKVLDLLHEVSRGRQVVLFTQEDEIAGWANEHLSTPEDRLIELPSPT